MRNLEFLILLSSLISLASCSKDTLIPAGTLGPNNTVISPTGRTWMDRNLGASQVAKKSTDSLAFGDLYQWGRVADGHQIRTSATTSTLSSIDIPENDLFIKVSNPFNDWRSSLNNDLWQGINGTNNPCPNGYRLPTETEINTERLSWSQNNSVGAFSTPLKFCLAGRREYNSGSLGANSFAYYWNSTFSGNRSSYLNYGSSLANTVVNYRAYGFSVRCLKD
jgi:hypothetical protein